MSSAETVRAEEMAIELPDGRSVTVLVNATPIHSEDGGLKSFVVTLQDLTPLEELERLRAEFLGMVSHELRTPLTSIKGSATTLLDEESTLDPAEIRQFHRIIVEQADHMRGLISELLDVARIETGTLSVYPEPSHLTTLVDEARKTFLSSGGRDNLNISLAQNLPKVMADRRRIVQVLGNLISNAATNSPVSSAIEITVVRDYPNVAVSVADQGRGLSEGKNRALDLDSSGLGLAICRGIVEAHGGRIWAESDGLGQGARLTFTIPAAEEFLEETVLHTPHNRAAALKRTRVLAVDDDPQALRYIRDALSGAGYDPVVTADPTQVEWLMENEKPNLVLLDLVLPGTDGIELMQSIQKTDDVPVIFLSAYGQQEDVARALDMGAVDYMVKPFAPSELAARVRVALRKKSGLGQLSQPDPYLFRDLSIDYRERQATVAGHTVNLTATEYAVLYELSVNAGLVMTHKQLLRRVWGTGHSTDSGLVRTIVNRLRRKLADDANNPSYIFTVPRVGYRMAKQEEQG